MAKQTHVHRLKKHKYPSGNAIFFCTLPDCHWKLEAALTLGKKALCNICGDEFIMNEYTIKLIKPHCNNCGKIKVQDADGKNRYVKKVTNKILSGLAESSVENLRSRLDSATSDDLDKDI